MGKLLSTDIKEIRTDKDFQIAFEKYPNMDRWFIDLSASYFRQPQRELIEQMWTQFKSFADSDFTEKIRVPGEFVGHIWEMTVGYALINQGYSLLKKPSNEGPDVIIDNKGGALCVEAIFCTRGDGADAVPEIKHGIVSNVPKEEMVLRVGNAVVQKFRKYQNYLRSGIVNPNDIFVIAINKGLVRHPDTYPPAALRYLYGIGDMALRMPIDENTGVRTVDGNFLHTTTKHRKK